MIFVTSIFYFFVVRSKTTYFPIIPENHLIVRKSKIDIVSDEDKLGTREYKYHVQSNFHAVRFRIVNHVFEKISFANFCTFSFVSEVEEPPDRCSSSTDFFLLPNRSYSLQSHHIIIIH